MSTSETLQVEQDWVTPAPARLLSALLNQSAKAPLTGELLPPIWHWLYFLPAVDSGELGTDGHPKVGGFIPDTGLPRRMFAGGSSRFLRDIRIGEPIERHSKITALESKAGRSGKLAFVTVQHDIYQHQCHMVSEKQNIVYREKPHHIENAGEELRKPVPNFQCRQVVTFSEVDLFRFSALTFNAHRIHYDKTYAKETEQYRNLVVQGPFMVLLLMEFFRENYPGVKIQEFDYRIHAPVFVDDKCILGLEINEDSGSEALLSCVLQNGKTILTANIRTLATEYISKSK